MARVTVEDCLSQLPNRFALVLLVSRRAKQILKGSEALVSSRNNRYIVNSLREVAAGHVYFDADLAKGTMAEQVERDLNK